MSWPSGATSYSSVCVCDGLACHVSVCLAVFVSLSHASCSRIKCDYIVLHSKYCIASREVIPSKPDLRVEQDWARFFPPPKQNKMTKNSIHIRCKFPSAPCKCRALLSESLYVRLFQRHSHNDSLRYHKCTWCAHVPRRQTPRLGD